MERLKTFLIYALIIVGFIILSEFLINVGLNSNYKDIYRKDSNSQVSIYQAQATLVNGRIKGIISNLETNQLNGKYIKIDFYSKKNKLIGTKYLNVENIQKNESEPFELYFKLENTNSYEISVVDEKLETEEIEIIPKDLTKSEIIVATIFTMLMVI